MPSILIEILFTRPAYFQRIRDYQRKMANKVRTTIPATNKRPTSPRPPPPAPWCVTGDQGATEGRRGNRQRLVLFGHYFQCSGRIGTAAGSTATAGSGTKGGGHGEQQGGARQEATWLIVDGYCRNFLLRACCFLDYLDIGSTFVCACACFFVFSWYLERYLCIQYGTSACEGRKDDIYGVG